MLAELALVLLDASVLSRLVDAALEIGVPVVSLFVMWLAHRLIKVFESKTGVDVPAKQEEMLDEWIKKGVLYAEEKGRAALKSKLEPIKGPEKMELAVSLVLDMVDKYGLKGIARDKVEKLVEAKLMGERVDPANPVIQP